MNRAVGIGLVVCASLFGLSAVVLMADNAAYVALQDHLPLRTVVGGVKIGGLSAEGAAVKTQDLAKKLEETPITLTVDQKTVTLTPKQLGVSIAPEVPVVVAANNPGQWVHFGFWKDFLTQKSIALNYTTDAATFKTALDDALGADTPAQDAALQTSTGQLVVVPDIAGRTVDTSPIQQAIKALATTGQVAPLTLVAEELPAKITADQITQLKTDVELTVQPMNFIDNNNTYQLDKTNIFSAIEVTSDDQGVHWQLNSNKLKVQLAATVARKVTIKMSPKTVQAADGVISSEGQDGREVKLDDLTKLTIAAVTQKTDTTKSPIVIPIKIIPHGQKTVYPSFVAGLYPGKYIEINLGEQKMYLLEGTNKIAEYGISTGKWSTPTPTGVMYIMNKISLAFSPDFGLWMPVWNALARNPDGTGYQGYGIHGLPCWNKSCTSREGAGHIGTPVSHGCIRLGDDGANFVYDWADVGTPVDIH